jgi:ABC-type sugar transport system ATPase subunit
MESAKAHKKALEKKLGSIERAYVNKGKALNEEFAIMRDGAVETSVRRLHKEEVDLAVRRVSRIVKIGMFMGRYPAELSGGQQQRVAIARTLAPEPEVLFMDEPLSNLDAKLRLEMRYELQRLHVETGSTFVYVTHDQMEAMTLATKICLINNGVLQQYEAPLRVYNRPVNLFVADFVGNPSINFIETKGAQQQDGSFLLTLLDGRKAIFRPTEEIHMEDWFKKRDNVISMTVFDPLGSVWYQGEDIDSAARATIERLVFLKSMTRQNTVQSTTDKNLIMAWYFDQFKQNEYQSDKTIDVPDEQDFVDVVRKYAIEFQKFMLNINTQRFVGNASMRPLPPQVGRCGKGMPSFRKDNIIFVSKRNINKQFIELDNFVPCYMDKDKLMYCGDEKPSVDTPVQIRLYEKLPQMKYMLHSHCYIKDAPFTSTAVPCGAIEEVDFVMQTINEKKWENKDWIAINLRGHGALIMWDNMDRFHSEIEPLVEYYPRAMPELMF